MEMNTSIHVIRAKEPENLAKTFCILSLFMCNTYDSLGMVDGDKVLENKLISWCKEQAEKRQGHVWLPQSTSL